MIKLIEGKEHNVIKRDGRVEPFSWKKLNRVLEWAVTHETGIKNPKFYVEEIKQNVNMRIYDRIHISKLFDNIIDVTASLASRMYPEYDIIARNLFIQKIYKELWGIKRNQYPDYKEVVKKGLHYGVYDKEIFNSFTEEELEIIGSAIDYKNDFKIKSYLGIRMFMDKYSLKYTKNKHLELPQHTLMRIAINAFYNDESGDRLEKIINFYNILANKILFTRATPYYLNAGTPFRMLASCVLTAMEDDSYSINKTCNNIGTYSKFGGGTACDVSKIRSVGSVVAKKGTSSGKIPFIKMIESVITSYNQLGSRQGACAVYYNWWDYEVEDLIMLKDEGGTEDKRARKLQYSIKINDVFIQRVLENKDITLFDPKDVPELLEAHGKKFTQLYEEYEQKAGIRKKTIKARDLAYIIAKVRNETGNLYIFFDDNANKQTPFKDYINSSNLCTEIFLPSRGSIQKDLYIEEIWNGERNIVEKSEGLISLCNLSSVVLGSWLELSDNEKEKSIKVLLEAHLNEIETAFYPVKEGEIGNKLNRPIGIGIHGLAYVFAKKGIKFTDEEAEKEMFDIMEDVAYHIYYNSALLAKERGKFPNFDNSKWAEGWLPIDDFKNIFDKYASDKQKERWDKLRELIKTHGVAFITHIAIAPTATSSVWTSSTEGIEPVKQLVATKNGTYTAKQFVPEIKKYGMNYQIAWEIPNEVLLKLAAIRQTFIDQGQSINTYSNKPDKAYDTIKDIIIAHKLGIKSLYYLNMLKQEIEEVCESCSS